MPQDRDTAVDDLMDIYSTQYFKEMNWRLRELFERAYTAGAEEITEKGTIDETAFVDLQAKLERYDDMLCQACKFIESTAMMSNAPDNLHDWWESRMEEDKDMEAAAKKEAARAKLTAEDRMWLGIE